jgi:hypothetical protein
MELGNPSAASSDNAAELGVLTFLYIDLKQYLTDQSFDVVCCFLSM